MRKMLTLGKIVSTGGWETGINTKQRENTYGQIVTDSSLIYQGDVAVRNLILLGFEAMSRNSSVYSCNGHKTNVTKALIRQKLNMKLMLKPKHA